MRTSIECPVTRSAVELQLEDDPRTMPEAWDQSLPVACPHCGGKHMARYRDIYVEGVLSGLQGDLEALLRMPRK